MANKKEQLNGKLDNLSFLWKRIDELGIDEEQLTVEEITIMVKEVRHRKN
ncbi:MAG: hypothetical protein KME09_21015 [Pleurocapsa minor HA4230-MV1]|nr:hypothetical protein [Pleurocapsa minor HA4230-MV1]